MFSGSLDALPSTLTVRRFSVWVKVAVGSWFSTTATRAVVVAVVVPLSVTVSVTV